MKRMNRLAVFSALIVSLALVTTRPALSQTSAAGSAFGEATHVVLKPPAGGSVSVDSGPLPEADGSGTTSYDRSNTAASVLVSSPPLGTLVQTGLMNVAVAATFNGNPISSASATVNGLNVTLGDLLGLSASTVQSQASVAGPCGPPAPSGSTTLTDIRFGGRLGTGLMVASSPAPNTKILDQLGVTVIANEQMVMAPSANERRIVVTALHIMLTNAVLTGIGTVSGDILIAQSTADLTCAAATPSADLSIAKSGDPNPVRVGSPLTYTIRVLNAGPSAAENVQVVDTLSPTVTYDSATSSQGSCQQSAGTVTCALGTLNASSTATVTIVVIPNATGPLANTAVVSSATPDPDPSNNTATSTVTVVGSGAESADLTVTKTASPNPVNVGDRLTYTLLVENAGPGSAAGVVISDTLPASATYVSASASQGSCSLSGSTVSCAIGTLAPGGSASVTIVVRPTVAGTLVNTAVGTSSVSDPNPRNNTSTVTVLVLSPTQTLYELIVPIVVRGDGPAAAHWRSDLGLVNLSGAGADAVIEWYPLWPLGHASAAASARVTVADQAEYVVQDVVQTLFSTQAAGSLRILSTRPIQGGALVYNDQSASSSRGRLSHSERAYPKSEALSRGVIPLLSQTDPGVTPGERAYIGYFNPTSAALGVQLRAYRADGTLLGATTMTVPAFANDLRAAFDLIGSVPTSLTVPPQFFITFESNGGPLFVYATSVDNGTRDGTLIFPSGY